MRFDARLDHLLMRWNESRLQGRSITPDELCRDCPELVEEMRRQIQDLEKLADSPTSPLSPPLSWVEQTIPPVFAGYKIIRKLGSGSMGMVYQAYDIKREEVVALKALKCMSPSAVYRFKNEFRALADVTHPNLVALYELVFEGQQWFFTMEFIKGLPFLDYVRLEAASEDAENLTGTRSINERVLLPVHLHRFRDALRQLAEGLLALHEAGILHRDIKHKNVLVTKEGRVVILDFGLAAELDWTGLYRTTEQCVSGTLAYMAPEQAAGLPLSPASDWYSVGVMIYEGLTGQLPFRGTSLQVVRQKQEREPTPPRDLVPTIPEDLNELCMHLLHRAPESRLPGREVLRALEDMVGAARATILSPPKARRRFVGRAGHLMTLREAFSATQQGRPVAVCVHGRSGTGKSALVQHFLDQILVNEEVVVLAGRCYERESVPYKALDSLLDKLSRYLRQLPSLQVQALLPREVVLLTRVFPVLQRIEAVAEAPCYVPDIVDPPEIRRRAFVALRELLARLGDRKALILFIDDLQWGDMDSAEWLSDLLRPPEPPVLLLIGCYRSEDASRSPFLSAFLQSSVKEDPTVDWREVLVDDLTLSESRELATTLLGREDPAAEVQAAAISRESRGNPFFIYELVHCVMHGGTIADRPIEAGSLTLEGVLLARIDGLPTPAKRLLEIIAVSGQPLRMAEAARAADLGDQARAAIIALRSAYLIRITGKTEMDLVETYHDRIRETVVRHLPPAALSSCHHRLALILEGSEGVDPETLAGHWQGAGELERAGYYYALAAERTASELAFDRAARLYRLALELGSMQGTEVRSLRTKLGDALANAGRGAEAAAEYQLAATGATAIEAIELRRRAAMQYLISGHFDEGFSSLRTVLEAVGMKLPRTPQRALFSLILRRAQLRLRGLHFCQREASRVPQEELTRIDICWSGVAGLSAVDPIRGAYFETRCLLLALKAGEPYRILRSLAMEAGHVSCGGGRTRHRTAHLIQATEELAQKVDQPHALAMVLLAKGFAAYLEGRWRASHEFCDRSERILRDRCTGVAWEMDSMQTFSLWALTYMGEVAELSRRWPLLVKEAQARGDLYATTNLSTYIMAIARLGADEPEIAQRDLDHVVGQWSRQGFHVQHHNAILAQALIHLYNGNGIEAWRHIAEKWSAYWRSLLMRVQQVRVDIHQLRGRSAVLAAASAADPRPFLRDAERLARRLERENWHWANATARLVRAGIAAVLRDKPGAERLYADASELLDKVDMRIYAEAARYRLGELVGGSKGEVLLAHALSWMAEQKIRNPKRMIAVFAPVPEAWP